MVAAYSHILTVAIRSTASYAFLEDTKVNYKISPKNIKCPVCLHDYVIGLTVPVHVLLNGDAHGMYITLEAVTVRTAGI